MLEPKSSWQLRATCRGSDYPDGFFTKAHRDSIDVCNKCPVQDLCRTYAIAHNELGVWGGTTQTERSRIPDIYKDLIRMMYYQAGLLEHRESLEEWTKLREEQRQARSVPTSQPAA